MKTLARPGGTSSESMERSLDGLGRGSLDSEESLLQSRWPLVLINHEVPPLLGTVKPQATLMIS